MGASIPSLSALSGTSCSCPSLRKNTAPTCSRFTSARTRPSSRKRKVPLSPLARPFDSMIRRSVSGRTSSLPSSSASAASVWLRLSPISWLGLRSTITIARSFRGSRCSRTTAGLARRASMTREKQSRSQLPRARQMMPKRQIKAAAAARTSSAQSGIKGANATLSPTMLLPQPLQDEGNVDLVRLVVTGQGIHDQIDAEAVGDLSLPFAARHDSCKGTAHLIDRPGRGPVVTSKNHGRNPVVPSFIRLLDPKRAAAVAPRKFLQEIESLCQNMIRWNRLQGRHLDAFGHAAQKIAAVPGEALQGIRAQKIDQESAPVLQIAVQGVTRRLIQASLPLKDRPIDQGKESQLISSRPDPHWLGRLDGGSPNEHLAETHHPRAAHLVLFTVSREQIGQSSFRKDPQGEFISSPTQAFRPLRLQRRGQEKERKEKNHTRRRTL